MQGNELSIKQSNTPSRKKKEYNELSLELRKDAIRKSAISNKELLQMARKRGKVDLSNKAQVEAAVDEYLLFESERGNVPNFEALCCFMGLSSAWVYEFLTRHSREESAESLELAKQSMVANRISLADSKIISEVFSIFILKNSRMGYADKHEITATAHSPLDDTPTQEELEAKYKALLESIPLDDE